MSSSKKITRLIPAMTISEGAGVTVRRTIGTPALRNYDPFLMLDYFNSDRPDEYIAGFPSHPHRGFNTFTYMIEGHMEHRDSMGNASNMGPGSGQWMKAGSGVIHSEMPKQENGLMRGFQLWINLPAVHKMDPPEYQEYEENAFPIQETPDYRVKILMGQFAGKCGPIIDDITNVSYFDVQLRAGKSFEHELPMQNNSFMFLFGGSGQFNGMNVSLNTLIAMGETARPADFIAGDQGARFLLVSGKPIGEPIVQYGPFVMNTHEEIEQAMQDFKSNNFVSNRAWVNRK